MSPGQVLVISGSALFASFCAGWWTHKATHSNDLPPWQRIVIATHDPDAGVVSQDFWVKCHAAGRANED